MGVMDYPMEVPHRNPLVGLGEGPIRRRLSATWHDPDNGLLEDSDANELVEKFDPNDTTNTSYNYNVGSQATNSMIARNTEDIAANASQISQLHNHRTTLKGRLDVVEENVTAHKDITDLNTLHVDQLHTYRKADKIRTDDLVVEVAECVRTSVLAQYVKVADSTELHEDHRRRITPIEEHVVLTNAAMSNLSDVVTNNNDVTTAYMYMLNNRTDEHADTLSTLGQQSYDAYQGNTPHAVGLLDLVNANRVGDIDRHEALRRRINDLEATHVPNPMMKPNIWTLASTGTLTVQTNTNSNNMLFEGGTLFKNMATNVHEALPMGNFTVRIRMREVASSTGGFFKMSGTFPFNVTFGTNDQQAAPVIPLPFASFAHASTHEGVPQIVFIPMEAGDWRVHIPWTLITNANDKFTVTIDVKQEYWG
jgi:hypothetical protein